MLYMYYILCVLFIFERVGIIKNVPRQIPSPFFGAPKIVFEKNKEKYFRDLV